MLLAHHGSEQRAGPPTPAPRWQVAVAGVAG